jgi:RHS repeat-associated protein
VADERRFEPFGEPIDANMGVDPYNSLNKERNAETGWSYHGARWMAPQTARWLTPDPPVKGPQPRHVAEPWELNPYQYAAGSPVLYWDPNGAANVMVDPPTSAPDVIKQLRAAVYESANRSHARGEMGCLAALRAGISAYRGDKTPEKGTFAKTMAAMPNAVEGVANIRFKTKVFDQYSSVYDATLKVADVLGLRDGQPTPSSAILADSAKRGTWSVYAVGMATGFHSGLVVVDRSTPEAPSIFWSDPKDSSNRGWKPVSEEHLNKILYEQTQFGLDRPLRPPGGEKWPRGDALEIYYVKPGAKD